MAMSCDLFLAILAMDSYNRGYNAGLNVAGNQIGNAVLGPAKGDQEAEAASFFAQAYEWNGQWVISYRGTDDRALTQWSDIYTGWPIGIGIHDVSQARLAASSPGEREARTRDSIRRNLSPGSLRSAMAASTRMTQ